MSHNFDDNIKDNKESQTIEDNVDNSKDSRCSQELSEAKRRYMYLVAEFENFKKRTEKERGQALLYGESVVLKDLLGILDDFERAFAQIESEKLPETFEKHLEGFKLILRSFEKLLEKYNITQVSYQEFNPEFHEAIMQTQSDNHKSGDIVQVLQKGYLHKEQLLRPAKVSVAQ